MFWSFWYILFFLKFSGLRKFYRFPFLTLRLSRFFEMCQDILRYFKFYFCWKCIEMLGDGLKCFVNFVWHSNSHNEIFSHVMKSSDLITSDTGIARPEWLRFLLHARKFCFRSYLVLRRAHACLRSPEFCLRHILTKSPFLTQGFRTWLEWLVCRVTITCIVFYIFLHPPWDLRVQILDIQSSTDYNGLARSKFNIGAARLLLPSSTLRTRASVYIVKWSLARRLKKVLLALYSEDLSSNFHS